MTTQTPRKPFRVLLAIALATTLLFALFTLWDIGRLWSPLDDAFLYAQYARQLAQGHLYEYYPGEGLSTGVTSPLYPWLLAPAFWVGLGGERIVVWWLALGVVWRVWAVLLVFALVRRWARDPRPAWAAAVLAALQGNYNWGVSSGMEVGMMSVLLLLSLRAGQRWLDRVDALGTTMERRRRWAFGLALALLALSRPEGAVTALAALVLTGWWLRQRDRPALRAWSWLGLALVPFLLWMAIVRVETDTFSTSGAVVKTSLGVPGYEGLAVLPVMVEGLRQTITWDLVGATNLPFWGWVAAAMGCTALLWGAGRGWRAPAERLPIVWLAGLLVPALSLVPLVHEARYQTGHFPLLVALGTYGVWRLGVELPRARTLVWGGLGGLATILFVVSLMVSAQRFAMQTEDMFYLHRRVAAWIQENTKPHDRIAVTDAGIIPYLTERPCVDLVGLVSRDLTGALSHGPGVVWHCIESRAPDQRPTYSALFPIWFDASELGKAVAEFRIDRSTIAVGPHMVITQWATPLPRAERRVPPEARDVIFRSPPSPTDPRVATPDRGTSPELSLTPNESSLRSLEGPTVSVHDVPPSLSAVELLSTPSLAPGRETRLTPTPGDDSSTMTWQLVDFLDHADLRSEREHDYEFRNEAQWQRKTPAPFAVAQASRRSLWRVADGGRSLTGSEQFRLHGVDPGRPLRLALRTYSDYAHRLQVLVDGRDAGILKIIKNNRSGIFDVSALDLPAEVLGGARDPLVRFELLRDGTREEFPLYTSFLLWALQPLAKGEGPERSPVETALENRIAGEQVHWARRFRRDHGDAIPIDSPDQVLFQSGWDAPGKDAEGHPRRWGLGPGSVLVLPGPGDTESENAASTPSVIPSAYLLKVDLEPYVPPGRRKTFWNWIALELNGHERVRWNVEPRRTTYRCLLPGDLLLSAVNELRFVYGRTYVPAEFELNSSDTRPLGAKFHALSLKPSPPGAPGNE